MNARDLLARYERVAEVPDAIPRLRRFILDLAVRGKLVPQSAADEPASVLLQRIAQEKARRLKLGEARQPKAAPKSGEPPCPLPETWRWSCIAEIGFLSPRVDAGDGVLASFVPMPLIAADVGVDHKHEQRKWGEIKKGYTHFAEGDVGLAKITPCFENGKSAVFRNLTGGIGSGTTELHVVRPILVVPDYVLLFFKSSHFIETGIPRMTGTAGQKRVPTEYFAYSPFPLPPLAEQHRIVAKVDELMALCDRLEAARAQRDATRDRLTASTLARLNTPDPETFQADARFAIGTALPALTARPDQIKQLRQTILNLAVRGKLVPQHHDDELASKLLKSIHSSREIIRRFAEIDPAELGDPLPELPSNWTWATVDQVASDTENAITDGPFGSQLKTEHYIETRGYRVIRLQNIGAGAFREEHRSYVDEPRFHRLSKHHIRGGDLVVAGLVDPSVRCCEVPVDIGPCLVKADCYRFSVHPRIASRFLLHFLNSQMAETFASIHHHGMTLTRIGLGNFRRIPVPLPPSNEQHRIVAKVDELMALCDQLEASLTRGENTRSRLLNALLHETLAPAQRELEVA